MKTGWQALVVLCAFGALFQVGCSGKVVVIKVPESVPEGKELALDGVVYALPRTVVRVAVPVDRTECRKGIYSDYAKLFFPDASICENFVDVAADKQTKFSIGTPTFSTFGEPDPSKLYYVELSGGGRVDRTATLDYTDQGTLSGVQGSADNYTTDIVLSAISAVSGVATRTVKFGGGEIRRENECPGRSSSNDSKVYGFFKDCPEIFLNYCQLDEINKDTLRGEVNNNNPRLIWAKKAYQNIRELNNKRRNLIAGDHPTPLPSLELMLKEIDALVARSIATDFTGQKMRETWTPRFELRPAKAAAPPIELFKFDEAGGVCLTQKLHAQDDPPDGFISKDGCKSARAKTLQIRFALDGQEDQQLFKRVQTVFKRDGEGEKRSFRYLIPAATLATLEIVDPTKGTNFTASAVKGGKAVLMVGQFGTEASLPASSGGRSLNYALKYFEATGAMKSFGLTSKTAMQEAVVNSFSSSVNAILDARKQQIQDAAEKSDELSRLERQRKILENRANIQVLCEKPGMNCQ